MGSLIFLTGTMGLGKSTLAQAWAKVGPSRLHIEVDAFRAECKAQVKGLTSASLEDLVAWRVYAAATDAIRAGCKVLIDSSGASKRFPYLRQALSSYSQTLVRLESDHALERCKAKWGSAISEQQIHFYRRACANLHPDICIQVDGKSVAETLIELEQVLGNQ